MIGRSRAFDRRSRRRFAPMVEARLRREVDQTFVGDGNSLSGGYTGQLWSTHMRDVAVVLRGRPSRRRWFAVGAAAGVAVSAWVRASGAAR